LFFFFFKNYWVYIMHFYCWIHTCPRRRWHLASTSKQFNEMIISYVICIWIYLQVHFDLQKY
jgi:hypothetical protein